MTQKVGPEMLEDSLRDFSWSVVISLPVDGDFPLTLNSGPRFQVLAISYTLGSGSCTLGLKDDGVLMTDFQGMACTTTPATTNGDGDADDIVGQASVLSLNVSSASGPPDSLVVTFLCRTLPEA